MEFPAIPTSIVDKISDFLIAVRDVGLNTAALAGPIARDISERVESLVTHLKPLWQATAAFITSNLGLASISLGSAVILMGISHDLKNPLYKTVLMISSLSLALVAGLFLANAGILPANILPI